ncbi:MAG: hypothetical protein K2X27_10295 [Candidatus Obscuribacterales bacterium]|nr:hypothetical protein [Candidatus Obscuribacterales bacterium]
MKIGLRFITSNSVVSQAIRAVTWSEYSHVDLIVKSNAGLALLGAQADGVKLRTWNYCQPTKILNLYADVPDKAGEQVFEFTHAQIGKPYDYTALVGNLLHRDWQEDDSWFCSELIAAAFDKAGYPLLNGSANRITPGMLLRSPRLFPKI